MHMSVCSIPTDTLGIIWRLKLNDRSELSFLTSVTLFLNSLNLLRFICEQTTE